MISLITYGFIMMVRCIILHLKAPFHQRSHKASYFVNGAPPSHYRSSYDPVTIIISPRAFYLTVHHILLTEPKRREYGGKSPLRQPHHDYIPYSQH